MGVIGVHASTPVYMHVIYNVLIGFIGKKPIQPRLTVEVCFQSKRYDYNTNAKLVDSRIFYSIVNDLPY